MKLELPPKIEDAIRLIAQADKVSDQAKTLFEELRGERMFKVSDHWEGLQRIVNEATNKAVQKDLP